MLYRGITSGGDMHRTNLRKVGGSVMLAVPPALLARLQMQPGARVAWEVEAGRLVIQPQPRPRYSLDQLLAEGAELPPDRDWLDDAPVGAELI